MSWISTLVAPTPTLPAWSKTALKLQVNYLLTLIQFCLEQNSPETTGTMGWNSSLVASTLPEVKQY